MRWSPARSSPSLRPLGLLLALLAMAAPARAQNVDLDLWVPNGKVFSLVRTGDTLYVCGLFKNVGP